MPTVLAQTNVTRDYPATFRDWRSSDTVLARTHRRFDLNVTHFGSFLSQSSSSSSAACNVVVRHSIAVKSMQRCCSRDALRHEPPYIEEVF